MSTYADPSAPARLSADDDAAVLYAEDATCDGLENYAQAKERRETGSDDSATTASVNASSPANASLSMTNSGSNAAPQQAFPAGSASRPAVVALPAASRSAGAVVSLFSDHIQTNSNAQFDVDADGADGGRGPDAERAGDSSSSSGNARRAPLFTSSALPPPPPPPRTPVNQILHATSFASPLSVNTPAPSMRRKGVTSAAHQRQQPTSATAPIPASALGFRLESGNSKNGMHRSGIPFFGGVGESPLMAAPPQVTPAKQRRTIHPTRESHGNNKNVDEEGVGISSGGVGAGRDAGLARSAASTTTITTMTMATVAQTSSSKTVSPSSAAAVYASHMNGGSGAGVRIPVVHPSKFMRSEHSRKRSADVMCQLNALDLDESVGSPTQMSVTNANSTNVLATPAHSVSSFAFPSQPSQQQRGTVFVPVAAIQANPNTNNAAAPSGNNSFGYGCLFPSTPLLNSHHNHNNHNSNNAGGYATPTTLSQHIDLSRIGDSLSQMLATNHNSYNPNHNGGGGVPANQLDYSQAETEYSNIFSKRILMDFREVRELGHGAFGRVALYEEGSTGELVAIKVSAPLHDGGGGNGSATHGNTFRREQAIMSFLKGKSRHMVQLLGSWDEGGRSPQMYLQLEYCPGGSVAGLAERRREAGELWPEKEVLVFLLHMALALDCMHQENLAHLDFKPDNVLIDAFGNYKLSDFGCSVALDERGRPRADFSPFPKSRTNQDCDRNENDATDDAETPLTSSRNDGNFTAARLAEWQAQSSHSPRKGTGAKTYGHLPALDTPQQSVMSVDEGDCRYLCSDMLNQKRYLKAGDMFALGMSLYELMSNEPLPRSGSAFQQLRRQVPTQALLDSGYSAKLVHLVSALLSEEPTARPTARQVLQHMRPAGEMLALIGDEGQMREWTSLPANSKSSENNNHDSGSNGDEKRNNGEEESSSSVSPSSAFSSTVCQDLRLASALMEASSWLLETTYRGYLQQHNRLCGGTTAAATTTNENGEGNGSGSNANSPQLGPGTGHTIGRSNSYAFSPPSCVTPVSFASPLVVRDNKDPVAFGNYQRAAAMQAQRADACTPNTLPGCSNTGGPGWQWGASP